MHAETRQPSALRLNTYFKSSFNMLVYLQCEFTINRSNILVNIYHIVFVQKPQSLSNWLRIICTQLTI